MGIKKIKFLSNETRLKIQTSQIINRLNSFINSEIELSPAQVTAALGLLKKSLPDLSAISEGMDETGKLVIETAIKSLPNVEAKNDENNADNAPLQSS